MQGDPVLPVHGPWIDGCWAAIAGRQIARADLLPATYFLRDAERLGKVLARGECDDQSDPTARPRDAAGVPDETKLHVGIARIGGKGDDLMTGAHCIALKRRFPNAHVTLFARDNTGHLTGHPGVDRIVFGGAHRWHEVARDLRERFDLFVDLWYVPKVWSFHPDLLQYGRDCHEKFEPLAWWYWNAPSSNRRLAELGKPLLDLTNGLLGLRGGPDDVKIALQPGDRHKAMMLQRLVGGYATLHNGSACNRQTKCWPTERWAEVVAALDVPVVLLGTAGEEAVEGALDLRGLTTVREAAAVIEGGMLHLDTEGGLAHMAQAVCRKAVVLFGPTPPELFGYPDQVALDAGMECRGCWYANRRWHLICPLGKQKREGKVLGACACMEAITVEQVVIAAQEALQQERVLGEAQRQETTNDDSRASGAPRNGVCEVQGAERGPCTRKGDDCPQNENIGGRPHLLVGIPTWDRPEALARLVQSIAAQTQHPDAVCIVNDGAILPESFAAIDGCEDVMLAGPRLGPPHSHQKALEYAAANGFDFVLRLDDDLVMESPDFIERLCTLLESDEKVAAAGGVYPPPEWGDQVQSAANVGLTNYSVSIGGMLGNERSAQFYRYDEARVFEAEHLYSSFMYRVDAALKVGGFPLCYSRVGHREETDFTLRLHLAGCKLLIDTGAVARHERQATGGLRNIPNADRLQIEDNRVFMRRLHGGELEKEAKAQCN